MNIVKNYANLKVMEVRKSDGSYEQYDKRKLTNIIKKVYRGAELEYTPEIASSIISNLYIYDGILCSSIRKQLEEQFSSIDKKLLDTYRAVKNKEIETEHFVEEKKKFIERYKKASNTANATVDDNSNVGNRNVAVLSVESQKAMNIQVSRGMIVDKLKEVCPDFNSKIYIKDLKSHIIYKNDESSFAGAIAPYCVSITMYPFLTSGLKNLGGLSAAPKNIDSFCGMFCNLVFAISSQFAGAVAVPEVLVAFNYFSEKEWGSDYYLRADEVISKGTAREKTIRKQIHQYFQQIIYTINQPAAARGFQSAFVNFSYFDEGFFNGMFGDFYFPDGTKPNWESVKWLQKEFMMWFNEERLKCLLTFPVESVTLLFKDGKFQDEDMFNFVCEEYARGHSFFTYISDSVDSLSSCCFDGKTRLMYSEPGSKYFERCISFKEAFDKYGESEIEVLSYNPHTRLREWKRANLIKTNTSEWNELKLEGFDNRADWTKFKVTSDHVLPVNRDGNIIDLPVSEIIPGDKLLFDKAQFTLSETDFEEIIELTVIEKIISDSDNTDCYCVKIKDESNPYFVLANGLITHNCRLKNKIQTKEFNFTNGNIGVMTGSKSVISFNLSRIIQDWYCNEYKAERGIKPTEKFDETKYNSLKKYITKILERVYRYHLAYNELLWDMYDARLLPAYSAGFIDLNKQYLTMGLNGLNQAAEFLGFTCNDNPEYSKFCQEIFGLFKEQNELHKVKEGPHKLTFNTEQVPAESLAIKNYNWDKEDGYWVPEDTNLYASYVYKPNDDTTSVLEKIKLMGSNYIGEYLDGELSPVIPFRNGHVGIN